MAIEQLRKIAGRGARCTLVCVYGNRAYKDTLVEMADAARACGFRVIAVIAAVAEHAILPQYATGMPDAADGAQLADFAARIAGKDSEVATFPEIAPTKKAAAQGLYRKRPGTAPGAACAPDLTADAKACIGCMRCVRQRPHHARTVNSAMVSMAAMALRKACSVKKENELYL